MFTDLDDEIEHDGFTLRASIKHDDATGAPWEEHDGHGPVSDWTRRDKLPGELLLCDDGRQKRFYDFAEACKIARRDGWGWLPAPLEIVRDTPSKGDGTACGGTARSGAFSAYDPENFNKATAAVYAAHRATMSPRAYAAQAARRDFDRLHAWCNDGWQWIGAIVTASRAGIELGWASLWGIESDAGEYLLKVASNLADEALADATAKMGELMS